jgi:hypothetical protein
MSDERLIPIDEYLSESWIEEWAGEGLRAAEEYLGKQAAFDSFLESE